MKLREVTALPVSYGKWLAGYRELYCSYTEGEARHRDENGDDYWVLFGDPQAPVAVLEVADERVLLESSWLDRYLRPTFGYLFVNGSRYDRDAEWLFLENVGLSDYDPNVAPPDPHDTKAPLEVPLYSQTTLFNRDGTVYLSRKAMGSPAEEATSHMSPEEMAADLWEPMPKFGEWDSIMRLER